MRNSFRAESSEALKLVHVIDLISIEGILAINVEMNNKMEGPQFNGMAIFAHQLAKIPQPGHFLSGEICTYDLQSQGSSANNNSTIKAWTFAPRSLYARLIIIERPGITLIKSVYLSVKHTMSLRSEFNQLYRMIWWMIKQEDPIFRFLLLANISKPCPPQPCENHLHDLRVSSQRSWLLACSTQIGVIRTFCRWKTLTLSYWMALLILSWIFDDLIPVHNGDRISNKLICMNDSSNDRMRIL